MCFHELFQILMANKKLFKELHINIENLEVLHENVVSLTRLMILKQQAKMFNEYEWIILINLMQEDINRKWVIWFAVCTKAFDEISRENTSAKEVMFEDAALP